MWCTNPCNELTGSSADECAGCRHPRYLCQPGADHFGVNAVAVDADAAPKQHFSKYDLEEAALHSEAGAELFEYLDEPYTAETCEFDVIDHHSAANLTSEVLYQRERPLLIRNAASSWAALEKWADANDFVERYGDEDFIVEPDERVSVREVLRHYGKYSFAHVLYPSQVCYARTFRPYGPILIKLAADYELPSYLKPYSTFQMGLGRGYGSGVPYESHTTAWFVVVAGTKRWVLTPPHEQERKARPAHPFKQTNEELNCDVLKRTPRTLQCDQKPGDVVLVPRYWWHATCGLDEWSIGIGGLEPLSEAELRNEHACDDYLYQISDVEYCSENVSRCPT